MSLGRKYDFCEDLDCYNAAQYGLRRYIVFSGLMFVYTNTTLGFRICHITIGIASIQQAIWNRVTIFFIYIVDT